MAARHKTDRIDLLRKQYLSGEAFVQKFPAAVQPYLLLSRYDKPIGYQLLFFPVRFQFWLELHMHAHQIYR